MPLSEKARVPLHPLPHLPLLAKTSTLEIMVEEMAWEMWYSRVTLQRWQMETGILQGMARIVISVYSINPQITDLVADVGKHLVL